MQNSHPWIRHLNKQVINAVRRFIERERKGETTTMSSRIVSSVRDSYQELGLYDELFGYQLLLVIIPYIQV